MRWWMTMCSTWQNSSTMGLIPMHKSVFQSLQKIMRRGLDRTYLDDYISYGVLLWWTIRIRTASSFTAIHLFCMICIPCMIMHNGNHGDDVMVTHQDGEGITPLHLACIQNRQNLAMILMNRWSIILITSSCSYFPLLSPSSSSPSPLRWLWSSHDHLLWSGVGMEVWLTKVEDLPYIMPWRKASQELFRWRWWWRW